eukprot:Gregarina_sp_Poly_1__9931@NODE_653_length_6929_cov_33_988487_g496_i0_p3_GENE_NODE_653_length_6929_cov_33_988487_g496_i0NODE_653_length_6929_cov_33_988487_g496_i0_p3_ORF_typecomplete_len533_score67_60DNA_pol_A/PF00476_20/1_7e65_NODE_653_length_6929_cov_33_988487_g496_i07742372
MTNPEEVGRILLHEILGQPLRVTKKYYSSKTVMDKVAQGNPKAEAFVECVKNYRSLKSVNSNLEAVFQSLMDCNGTGQDGRRIYPHYEALRSTTGRISSQLLDVLCYEKGVLIGCPFISATVTSEARPKQEKPAMYPPVSEFDEMIMESLQSGDLSALLSEFKIAPVRRDSTLSSACPMCQYKLFSGSYIWGVRRRKMCDAHSAQSRKLRSSVIELITFNTSSNPTEIIYAFGAWDSKAQNVVLLDHHSRKPLGCRNIDEVWIGPGPGLWTTYLDEEAKILIGPRELVRPGQGRVLVAIDYCQIELRLLTHFSGDSRLTEILRSSADPFKLIAAAWLNKTQENISATERAAAKRCTYGILYGMEQKNLNAQISTLTEELISDNDADPMESFFNAFPETKTFLDFMKSTVAKDGFVRTLAGRRRCFPPLKSGKSSQAIRSKCLRQGINTLCQGSAADLMKIVQCAIHELFAESRSGAKIILQIHDELLLELPKSMASILTRSVLELMVSIVPLRVPLRVRWRLAESWADCADV